MEKVFIKSLPIKYRGLPVVEMRYKFKNPSTINKVYDMTTATSRELYNKGLRGTLIVSCLFPAGWRAGLGTNIGEPTDIFDFEVFYDEEVGNEEKRIFQVSIFVLKRSQVGGSDKYNDCLYFCISDACNGYLPSEIKTPKKFKKFCQVGRSDKVPADCIPQLDKLLVTMKINCSGDYSYVSPKDSLLVCNIELSNEHYKLKCNENRATTKTARFKPIDQTIYTYTNEMGNHLLFVIQKKPKKKEEYNDMRKDFNNILVLCDSHYDNIVDYYNDYIKEIEQLKKDTNNLINMYKYEKWIHATSDIWRIMSKGLQEPEAMSTHEILWIDRAFGGGLMYAQKDYEGDVTTYDINSCYPSHMAKASFEFPVKAGTFKTITTNEMKQLGLIPFGIFRCKIEKKDNMDKLFQYRKNNYYTQHDLRRAIELGLNYEMIDDGQANSLIYDKSTRVKGSNVFSKFVDYIFNLKKNGNKSAKKLINVLWGSLCEKVSYDRFITQNRTDAYEIHPDHDIKSLIPTDEGYYMKIIDNNKLFKSSYARIAPFLTAYARYHLSKAIEPIKDKVVRVHTDSITIIGKDKPDYITIGRDLGQWKIEENKTGSVKIHHVNKLIFS